MPARSRGVATVPAAGMPFCCSWSGGKDSCLALFRAAQSGALPVALVTVFAEDETRTRSHGLHRSVVEAQAEALGLPLWTVATTWKDYRENLIAALTAARRSGAEAVVFGDLDIESHRDWELSVSESSQLQGHLPLWSADRRQVLEEWWRLGFVARVVVVRDSVLPRALLGRSLDARLVETLERHGADVCGENGEFHTLATDGPLFRHPLFVLPGVVVKRADCWVEDLRVTQHRASKP